MTVQISLFDFNEKKEREKEKQNITKNKIYIWFDVNNQKNLFIKKIEYNK